MCDNRLSAVFLACFLLLGATRDAGSDPVFAFNGFGSTSGLALNGDAAVEATSDGQVLRLAPAEVGQRGTCYTLAEFNITDFSTYFAFRIQIPPNAIGADGISFTVQPLSPERLGWGGGGLGYGSTSAPTLAVEFDTYRNDWDPDSNHLGVDSHGSVASLVTTPVAPNWDDGQLWHAWIHYSQGQLDVYTSQQAAKPSMPTLSYAIDIPSTVGRNTAYVGFTAATGSGYADHDIVNWSFTAVPEPSSLVLMLGAFAAVVGRRLRRRAKGKPHSG